MKKRRCCIALTLLLSCLLTLTPYQFGSWLSYRLVWAGQQKGSSKKPAKAPAKKTTTPAKKSPTPSTGSKSPAPGGIALPTIPGIPGVGEATPPTTPPTQPGVTPPTQPGVTPPTQPGVTPPTQPGVTPPTQPGVTPPTQPGVTPPVTPGGAAPVVPVPPGGTAVPLPTLPQGRPSPDLKFGMTFEKANILDVLKVFSRVARVTIVPDPNLQGTVTIISPDQMTLKEAFEVLKSVVRVQGYQIEGDLTDKVIKVVPRSVSRFNPSVVGKDDPTKPPATGVPQGEDVITWVIPVRYTQASRLVTTVQRLVDQTSGVVAADTDANALIIVDSAANVKRIAQVVKELDVDQSQLFGLDVIELKYAYAPSVLETLTRVFSATGSQQRGGTGGQNQRIQFGGPGGFGPGGFTPGGPGGFNPGGLGGPGGGQPGVVELRGDTLIAADERTNSILVSAPNDRIALVKDIVQKLDKDVSPEVEYRVFQLKNADATQVADMLNEIFEQPQGGPPSSSQRRTNPTLEQRIFGFGGGPFGGQRQQGTSRQSQNYGYAGLKENIVIPDVRTNSILVTAAKGNVAAFEKMVEELDKETTFTELTRIYRLQNAKAEELADTLNYVFSGQAPRGIRTQQGAGGTTGRTGTGQQQGFRQGQQTTFGGGGFGGGGFGGGGFGGGLFGGGGGRTSQAEGSAEEFLRRVVVVPEAKTNSLIITAPLQARPLIEQLIAELDQRTPQVFIEVLIADVTLTKTSQFSIEYAIQSLIKGDSTAATQTLGTVTPLNPNDPFHGTGIGTGTGGFRYSIITQSGKFQSLLRAIATNSNVKVLSRPQVTVLDNVPATISIGQQFPYVSGFTETTGLNPIAQIEFVDINIQLDVTPHVSIQDLIQMDIAQTINELVEIRRPAADQEAPVIGTRSATTSVQVKSGQTIVLGGIIRDSDTKTLNKIPVLGDLPVFGGLFRSRNTSRSRVELMIFITPYVVRSDEGVDQATGTVMDLLSVPLPPPTFRLPMPSMGSVKQPGQSGGQKSEEKKEEPKKEEPKKEEKKDGK
jgi:general secretion pathway protein D